MDEIWSIRARKILHFFMFSALFFSLSSSCYAVDCSKYTGAKRQQCVLKSTLFIDATTKNDNGSTKRWYVSNDTSLDTYVVCDDGYDENDPNYAKYYPCDKDGDHDCYFSTSNLKQLLSTVERDFTISASASAYDTTMKSVKIEWMTGDKNVPSSWSSARSFTCDGGSCVICREGGSCSNDSIYPSEIGTLGSGAQKVLWFRVTATDNDGNSVTTGWDSYKDGWTSGNVPTRRDKFYRFVFCSDVCRDSCDNSASTIKSMSVTDKCSSGGAYTFNWTTSDAEGDSQSAFRLEIQDTSTGDTVFNSKEVSSSSKSYTSSQFIVGKGVLEPNRTYKWRLYVKDDHSDCSAWSSPMTSTFTTCKPNSAPNLTTSIVSPTCENLNNFNYTLKWNFSDIDGDTQKSYQFQIYDKSNTSKAVCDSSMVTGTTSQLILGSDTKCTLSADKTYSWRVRAVDSHGAYSAWKSGPDLTTFAWPSASFKTSCTSGTDCYYSFPITFTSTSAASSPTYSWYIGTSASSSSSASSLIKTWASGGPYNIKLVIKDKYGHTCKAESRVALKVKNDAPVVSSASVDSPTSCSSPKNFNYTLKWSFSDSDGGDTQKSYQVQIYDKSNTSKAAYDSSTVTGTTSQLTLGSDTRFTLSADKTYSWRVRVADNHDEFSAWKSGPDLPTFAWPSVSFKMSCTSGSTCNLNSPITFTSTSTASSPAYKWYVDGVQDRAATEASFTKTWTSGSSYKIKLSITDKYNHTCTSPEKKITLTEKEEEVVNNAPTLTSSVVSSTSCRTPDNFNYTLKWAFSDLDGDSQDSYRVQITNKSSGRVVYDTQDVSGDNSEMSLDYGTYTLDASAEDTYSWKVQVTDSRGAVSAWKSGSDLPTHPWPSVDFEQNCTSGTDCYLNNSITFTSTSTASSPAYTWYIDGKSSGSGSSLTKRWTSGSSYKVKLSIKDGYSHTCENEKTISLTEEEEEIPAGSCSTSLSLSDSAVYTGEKITASGWTSDAIPPVVYHWKLNGDSYNSSNTKSTQSYTFSSAGIYAIGVYATDGANRTCAEVSKTIDVSDAVVEKCEASFSISSASPLHYGDAVSVNASSSGVSNPVYKWTITSESGSNVPVGAGSSVSFKVPDSDIASTTYLINLQVSGDKGASCGVTDNDKVIIATKRSPRWNETIPNLIPIITSAWAAH